ncbi:hypothetical protein Skr01_62850 [Sphaerisporangium krabiense]|uniref:Uncharacterized protein n=1 Tax=Sphaerisporangium krabiense TaxID=763782 RepID=A0A7W8Z6E8_9ACTN|nr:hypothetical protein [Sphaerisporangium krabiense]MBB5628205.1 hypothetical protein [Sphaerisporangium krabiense]GII66200.1 hypothetical protein Skr01_62850 [Sphaerisporangium krabiense]
MSVAMDNARKVADAVLYEGYLLYPYRASAAKNRVRWQFGVLVPPAYTATSEPSSSVTECLLDGAANALVRLRLRFLHVKERRVERADGGGFVPVDRLDTGERSHLTFDEATEREVEHVLAMPALLGVERTVTVRVPGDRSEEAVLSGAGEPLGRVVCEHRPLHAVLDVTAEAGAGPHGLVKLRVRTRNLTGWTGDGTRDQALRRSLVAAHLLIGVTAGRFLSLSDPPEWARPAARGCVNENTWPVLVAGPGGRDAVLSSPIILYDHPRVAPESPGDLCDATEIDELLHLRTRTLTEEEKREAAATDPRAAEIVRLAGELPPEMMERLHGVMRHEPATPWWDPAADAAVSPDTDTVTVAGVEVAKGSRVRLTPGRRRADAHDMFLAGRTARVEAVLSDVDGAPHLAVTLEEDPGADLHRSHGRYLYFAPDEVEPLAEPSGKGSA